MKTETKRIKQIQWIHTSQVAVRLEVDAVIPPDDTSEPCLEPATVEFLDEVSRRAEAGDLEWLKGVGDVYVIAHARSA